MDSYLYSNFKQLYYYIIIIIIIIITTPITTQQQQQQQSSIKSISNGKLIAPLLPPKFFSFLFFSVSSLPNHCASLIGFWIIGLSWTAKTKVECICIFCFLLMHNLPAYTI